MDLQLKDKIALVTASTAGIGRALAEGLLKEGVHVIINGRSEGSVDKALQDLKPKYQNVEGVAAELGNAEECQHLIDQIKKPIDILINNFGIYEAGDFFETNDALWQNYYECNVMSGVRLSRHFLKPMLEKNWGRIIFVSSESGLNIPKDMIHYGMTKTAILAIMRGLAKLTKGTEVTVNAIVPGPTKSKGAMQFIGQMAEKHGISQQEMEKKFLKENYPTSLIGRFVETEEIAPMAVSLCSPLSIATNGSAVKVDGGVVDQIM